MTWNDDPLDERELSTVWRSGDPEAPAPERERLFAAVRQVLRGQPLPPEGGAWLLHVTGLAAPVWVAVHDGLCIGRLSECAVALPDPAVSKRHAQIDRLGEGWTIRDLDSANGLRVNRVRCPRHELAQGDVIEVGTTVFIFLELTPTASPGAPP